MEKKRNNYNITMTILQLQYYNDLSMTFVEK